MSKGFNTHSGQPVYDPTAAEIRRRCEEIQRSWSAKETNRRCQVKVLEVTIPIVALRDMGLPPDDGEQ